MTKKTMSKNDQVPKPKRKLTNARDIIASGVEGPKRLEALLDLASHAIGKEILLAEEFLLQFYDEYYSAVQTSVIPNSRLDFYEDPVVREGLVKLDSIRKRADKLTGILTKRLALSFSEFTVNRFTNPTGGGIRPQDPWGSGVYQSPRNGGSRLHAGVDYLGQAGSPVYAGIGGAIETINEGVRITGRVEGILYTVRQIHIIPSINNGRVTSGQQIATVEDLRPRYPGINNHCHIEIYRQPGDNRLDPTPFFGG